MRISDDHQLAILANNSTAELAPEIQHIIAAPIERAAACCPACEQARTGEKMCSGKVDCAFVPAKLEAHDHELYALTRRLAARYLAMHAELEALRNTGAATQLKLF